MTAVLAHFMLSTENPLTTSDLVERITYPASHIYKGGMLRLLRPFGLLSLEKLGSG